MSRSNISRSNHFRVIDPIEGYINSLQLCNELLIWIAKTNDLNLTVEYIEANKQVFIQLLFYYQINKSFQKTSLAKYTSNSDSRHEIPVRQVALYVVKLQVYFKWHTSFRHYAVITEQLAPWLLNLNKFIYQGNCY